MNDRLIQQSEMMMSAIFSLLIVYNDTGFKKLDNSNLIQKYLLIYNYVLVNYTVSKNLLSNFDVKENVLEKLRFAYS